MQHQSFSFPHNRLDVFRVALDMAVQAKRVADRVPRGHRSLADQLLRSSGSTVHQYRQRSRGWRRLRSRAITRGST
jgi:hypothetical protein